MACLVSETSFQYSVFKRFCKIVFQYMLSQPKQNLVCLAWDFHSKTGINTHLIKIYHKPVSVLNWDPTQTHRGRNKRQTERGRSKRDKQREAGVRFGYPDPTPQQHLGWCSTTITESSTVCVCERDRDRRKQRERKREDYVRKKFIILMITLKTVAQNWKLPEVFSKFSTWIL